MAISNIKIENFDKHFEALITAINSGANTDWSNIMFTLVSICCAGFSAYCAWRANQSSQMQANRDYFDKIYGDELLLKLKDVKKSYRVIQTQLIQPNPRSNNEMRDFRTFLSNLRSQINKLSEDAIHIDNFIEGEAISDHCDEIDDQIVLISEHINAQNDGWHEKSNKCLEQMDRSLEKIMRLFHSTRDNFKQNSKTQHEQ